ncbi:MAG: DUF4177 domain-containing protein [Bacillota bacterium]|nr:DUF4177 domain-containing protein [Bacillota bacterium]
MCKWEYKSVLVTAMTAKKLSSVLEEKSNELGKEGYELACFDGVEAGTIIAVFKKPIEE